MLDKTNQKKHLKIVSRENTGYLLFYLGSIFMQNNTHEKNRFDKKVLVSGVILLFILIGAVTSFAQDKQFESPKQTSNDQGQAITSLVVSPNEDYLIGPSDVIDIKIEDAPELSGTFRINAKGTLTLPEVGQLTVLKKTTDEIARTIADKLRGGYLMKPIVSVTVKQSNSRAFFIQGAVRRPGIYQIEGRTSLLQLISIAGGLADNYGSTAFVIREKQIAGESGVTEQPVTEKTGGVSETVKISKQVENASNGEDDKDLVDENGYLLVKANINNLLRGNLGQNLVIQPGDIVHIPQSDVFFVAGEVKSPGSFPLREGTTVRQAISLAQGTNFEGNLDKSIIFREDQNGKRQEIQIDVAAIMSGKKEDIEVLPNDIIIVPNSKKKALTKGILKTLSTGFSIPRLFGF